VVADVETYTLLSSSMFFWRSSGSEGPESPAVEARIGRILLAARVDILILVSIVFMMVTKVGQ
jgi:hypothetical protein